MTDMLETQRITFIFFVALALTLLVSFAVPAATPVASTGALRIPAYVQRHDEMIYNTVLVEAQRGGGSGTVLFSGDVGDEIHTYVLTNFHVIAGNVSVNEEWDTRAGKNVKKEKRTRVNVLWFQYNDYSKAIGNSGKRADIVAYNKDRDLALLRLVDKERKVDSAAYLHPEDSYPHLSEEIWAVGAGLGEPPFVTRGLISAVDRESEGNRYLLSSADIIFGNSGGGQFLYNTETSRYEFIGVPSAISRVGWSFATHMAWIIPHQDVFKFFRDECYQVILGESLGDDCKAVGEFVEKKDEE